MKRTEAQILCAGQYLGHVCNSLYRTPCGEVKTLDIIYMQWPTAL